MKHAVVIPVGVGGALPVTGRGLPACALRRPGGVLLFDCGEGTQLRLASAGVRVPQIEAVLITHLHGDHFFGLPGLLTTSSMLRREAPLTVIGPLGIRRAIQSMPGAAADDLSFQVRYVELNEDAVGARVFEGDGFAVSTHPLDHGVPTFGFRYEEEPVPGGLNVEKAQRLGVSDPRMYRVLKGGDVVVLDCGRTVRPEEVVGPDRPGGTFAYVTDTRPCEGGLELARHADLVYHDSTFGEDQQHRALETGHSTASEAAGVAAEAEAHRLLLGHFSGRYRELTVLEEQAREVFSGAEAAVELRPYEVRGAEDLVVENKVGR